MMGPPMPCRYCTKTLSATLLIFAVVHTACASEGQLRPFSTDGCSVFPDRSLISKADWCQCCVAHDLAYWRGGTSQARLSADKALSTCVLRVTANKALADLMGQHWMELPVKCTIRKRTLFHAPSPQF